MSKQLACASCIKAKPDNKDFEHENEINSWLMYVFCSQVGNGDFVFPYVFGQNVKAKWH